MIVILAALTLLPRFRIDFGPFGDRDTSITFLSATWQVLGAAVGVSVALIAFVLEAFMTSGERRFGGTLREFVSRTHLLWLFDVAAAALLLDGVVLAGAGHGAPGGWPGLVAALLSGVTLGGLLIVVPRTILSALDPSRLWSMRTSASQELARSAVETQLIGQLASQTLHDSQQRTHVSVNPLGREPEDSDVTAGSTGVVVDIRLGALWRAARVLGLEGDQRIEVLTEIGRTVRPDTRTVALPRTAGRLTRRRIRRAIRVAHKAEAPEQQLTQALERLKQQGIDAARRGDDAEWRDLGDLLVEQLLELPRRTAELGLAFDGAVSKPGLFGRGPSRRILDVLADVRDEAARREERAILNNIMYLPRHVCGSAEHWDAPDLIGQCLMFYPQTYVIADRASLQSSGIGDHLRREAIEQLFETVQYGAASAIAFGQADDQQLDRASEQMLRGLHAVQELFRAVIRRGDQPGFDQAYRALTEIYEDWESWEPGRRTMLQQQLMADIDSMRLALTAWAVHHLESADSDAARQRTLRGFAVRLASPVGSDELLLAFDALSNRQQRVGSDDVAWWYFDDSGDRVQSISAESQLARAVILGLWMRAAGGQMKLTDTAPIGHHADALQDAVTHLRDHPTRYQPSEAAESAGDGDEDTVVVSENQSLPVEILDDVSKAVSDHRDREVALERQRVRDAELDPTKTTDLLASIASAVEKARRLPSALPPSHVQTVDRDAMPGHITARQLVDKRYLLARPGFAGPETLGAQIGRYVGTAELADLVSALMPLPVQRTADLRQAVRDALVQLRGAGYPPGAILTPGQGDLADQLDGEMAAAQGPFGGRAAQVVDGVPIVYRRDLDDRLLIVSLKAVSLRQSDVEGGVRATVTAVDEELASELYKEHEDEDREAGIARLREKALVDVWRCWEVDVDAAGHRAIGPLEAPPASDAEGTSAVPTSQPENGAPSSAAPT
jgi:hypothetical protein